MVNVSEMTSEEVVNRLVELLGPHGFAQLEALNESLRKNPPTRQQYRQMMRMVKQTNRLNGVTNADIAAIKKELFG